MSPQICMVTFDSFRRQAFRAGFSEGQDVLRKCANVDLIHLEPSRGFEFRDYWQRRLAAKDISGTLAKINPGLREVRLKKDYDLFIFLCPVWLDAMFVNAVKGWRDRCKTSVCWIVELWANRVPDHKNWLPSFNRFDHLFVGPSGSVEPVKAVTGKDCECLPVGIDALRFTPYPVAPPRVIDFYSIGRKLPAIHRSLMKLASEKGLFYIHDTLQHSDSVAQDFREHREHFASLAKRSRFFLVAPSKIDCVEQAFGGQSALASRYFEGAAAGAVLLGQAPTCDSYREMFPWSDAVVEIQANGSDTTDVVVELLGKPEKMQRMSRQNATAALLRHDWVYRWERVFNVAGLSLTPQMHSRKQRLKMVSEIVACGDDSFGHDEALAVSRSGVVV